MEIASFSELAASGRFRNKRTVLSIGVFEGMHKGHQRILSQLADLKKELCADISAAITFSVNPKGRQGSLDTLRTRAEEIEAYGVDIHAHREALANGYETIGVLAHGLDELYPTRHRETAVRMLTQGGLLTEFLTQSKVDKINFVRRNRIVAGISDACVLVESAAKGGGLITAGISQSYGREVFAFPGRLGDVYSEGCNRLIMNNGASLLLTASDFVQAMGWETDMALGKARKQGIEREMFPELSDEEQVVVNALQAHNDLQINMLAVQANIPIGKLTALLFSLEMKGVIKALAGGTYHLLMR